MKAKTPEEKIIDGKVRVPLSLMVELRQEAARYGSKGLIPPTHGEMLAEAWECRKLTKGVVKKDDKVSGKITEALRGESEYSNEEAPEDLLREILSRVVAVHVLAEKIPKDFGHVDDGGTAASHALEVEDDPFIRAIAGVYPRSIKRFGKELDRVEPSIERLEDELDQEKRKIREAHAGDKLRTIRDKRNPKSHSKNSGERDDEDHEQKATK